MKNFFLMTLIATLISCQKKTDCVATINCNDVNDEPVKGASVFIFAMVKKGESKFKADLTATGSTDNEGKVSFTFKLPAVYDVSVAVGTQTASGLIKLEEGKTVNKVLIVK